MPLRARGNLSACRNDKNLRKSGVRPVFFGYAVLCCEESYLGGTGQPHANEPWEEGAPSRSAPISLKIRRKTLYTGLCAEPPENLEAQGEKNMG